MADPTDLRRAILDQASRREPDPPAPRREPEAQHSYRDTQQPSRAGKVSVTAYFTPEIRRQLRRLAADRDTTIQALLGEALNDLFAKHGLPEIVPRE